MAYALPSADGSESLTRMPRTRASRNSDRAFARPKRQTEQGARFERALRAEFNRYNNVQTQSKELPEDGDPRGVSENLDV